jgi:hypothetical protein
MGTNTDNLARAGGVIEGGSVHRRLTMLLLFALAQGPLDGQPARLVKDINPLPGAGSSSPSSFVQVGKNIFS